MTLRGKLLSTLLALLAVAIVIVDFSTSSSLRSFLIQRLDQQIVQAVQPAERYLLGAAEGANISRQPPFIPIGSYEELITSNGPTLVAAIVSSPSQAGSPPLVTKTVSGVTSLTIPINSMTTVPSVAGDGITYRVYATKIPSRTGYVLIAAPLSSISDTLHQLDIVELLVSVGVLLLITSAGGALLRIGLKPLNSMTETAGAIADGDLTRRVETQIKNDEVGKLASALNKMLTRIENAMDSSRSSEERLRRFVADASHELRTPLTSIRGYAELFQRGGIQGPEQTARAMQRIESEAIRMSALVEDLLLLAKLDQDRSVEYSRVDLAQIARDAIEDARAVEPTRPIRLSGLDHALVNGDANRLTQVVANLLSNARSHTSETTQVELRIEEIHGEPKHSSSIPYAVATAIPIVKGPGEPEKRPNDWIRLMVRDAGPGIAGDDLSKVFERFFRTDSSRSRTQGGSGLGLSLVAAIAEAHNGQAWVSSKGLGEGTTFGVDIPAYLPSNTNQDPGTSDDQGNASTNADLDHYQAGTTSQSENDSIAAPQAEVDQKS